MPNPSTDRPKNRQIEYEEVRPQGSGPPRPATEPKGAEASVKKAMTATDPGSGQARNRPDPKTTARPKAP